jgi:hypothetical protein
VSAVVIEFAAPPPATSVNVRNQLGMPVEVDVVTEGKKVTSIRIRLPQSVSEIASERGKLGAAARNAKMTPERRSELARAAARKRWEKPKCPEWITASLDRAPAERRRSHEPR